MYQPAKVSTTLQVGTSDGIFTLRVDEQNEAAHRFSASLRGSPIWAIAVDPVDPAVVLAGCGGPGAGLYYSRDGGLTWEAPGLWPANREVWALAFNPRDPRIVLAGTQPAAVYASSDRGYTWDELSGLAAVPGRAAWTFPQPPHQAHVRKLFFDPSPAETILAAVEVGGVLLSGDGGRAWDVIGQGVHPDVHAVAFWPGDARVVLAATGGGIFRSEKRGDGWSRVGAKQLGEYVVALALEQREPWTIFVSSRGGEAVIGRSEDGGATWQPLGEGLPAPDLGVDALAIDPRDPAVLYYGAQDPADRRRGCLFISGDGGQSWRRLKLNLRLPKITRLAAC